MKAIYLFVLIIFCSITSFAQQITFNWDHDLLPQGYSFQPQLNSSTIGLGNPSFLSRFEGISAGLSYQYGTKIENVYFGGLQGNSLMNGLPYAAGVSFQTGSIHIGAAITQKYNLKLEIPNIKITTEKSPEVIGETVEYFAGRDIHDYSLISAYRIENLPGNNSLSLGIRMALERLSYFDHGSNTLPAIETSAYAVSFAFGADYILSIGSGDLHLGASFEKGSGFNKDIMVEPPAYTYTTYTGRSRMEANTWPDIFRIEVTTPDILRLDIAMDLPRVQVTASLSEVFWSSVQQNHKNNLDIGAGISYKASERLSLSLGAFMNDRKNEIFHPLLPEYKALFISLGADAAFGNYTIGFSISDSHLFSAEARKQTIGRLLLSYQF